jgi:FAD-dependent oxidoreductase domain-containing protein 1
MKPPHDLVDVAIVGGAVVGSAVAYFLAVHSGFRGRVVLIEKDPGYTRCATALSVASIRHQFSTRENILMSMFGTEFLREVPERLAVAGDVPAIGFREAGYLFLASAAGQAVLQHNHALQRQLGADIALLTPAALAQRLPALNVDDIALAALGLSGEGWLDAHALMHGLRRKAQSLGVQMLHGEVVGLHTAAGRVQSLQLADGRTLACGAVVNAAGTGAAALAQKAGIRLPVQARKRCVFHFHSPAAIPQCPLVIDPSGVYFRPEGAGFIAGVAPPEHADPPSDDFEVDWPLWEDQLWPTLAHRVPGFAAARVHSAWAGHYDVNTLDHNAILGSHPQVENLYFANGFSGHGLQQAPAVGRAIAELIVEGGYQTLDLSALGWGRVLRNEPLRELNVV